MLSIDDVRRIYSVRSVLGLDNHSKKILCPLPQHIHHNNTPSCSIFIGRDGVERFECHGNCGIKGDVIDLIGYMQLPDYRPNNPASVSDAINQLTSGFHVTMPTAPPPDPTLPANAWMKYFPPGPEVVEYALRRGIVRDTLEIFKVGQSRNFMAMPAFEDAVLRMIKFRNMGTGLRFYAETGSRAALFNHDQVAYSEKPLIIVKGEIPCMVLWQRGVHCCAFTAGEGMRVADWLPKLIFAKRRIVIGDNDRDPSTKAKMQAFTRRTAAELEGIAVFPPPQFKDIDDWVLADSNAVSVIKEWLV